METKVVSEETTVILQLDALRTVLQARILKFFCRMLTESQDPLSKMLHMSAGKLLTSIKYFEMDALRACKDVAPWLQSELKKDKLFDLARVTEMLVRIGVEEKDPRYEEILSMVIELLDTTFYVEKNRKMLHFSKYKAMMKLFNDEIRRDVNGEKEHVIYHKGNVYFRANESEVIK